MSETPTPTNLEAFEQFKKDFNLDPQNNLAIMNCLFELWERQNEIAKEIILELSYRDSDGGAIEYRKTLFDKWNNQK